MWQRWLFILLFLSFTGVQSCQRTAPAPALVCYHWQTQLNHSEATWQYVEKLGSKELFVRFFDIDDESGQGNPSPKATIEYDQNHPIAQTVVPVVFITNRTFEQLTETTAEDLALKVKNRIFELYQAFSELPPPEIQMDCDWTVSTRAAYFSFLEKLETTLPATTQLSVTIRLHQVKYPEKTGVPPADRGTLMYYNTGDIQQWATKNSIYEAAEAAAYLGRLRDYPLPLDIALPLFEWGLVFRGDELISIIHLPTMPALQDSSRFAVIGKNRFQAKKGTYFDGYYLYAGDRLKIESIYLSDLQKMVSQLQAHFSNSPSRILFYHLDERLLPRFPTDSLRILW